MVDLTIYIVEANVLLLILALVYLIIKNQISLGQRRTLLIIIPFVSLLIPVLKIVNFQNLLPVYNLPVFDITQIQTGDISKINADHILAIPAYDRIYLSISLILALIWSLRIGYLIIHLKFKQHEDYNGLHILRIPDKNCFSFLRFIQLDPNLAYEAQEIVLEHEQVHVDKKHSYDIILMGLLRSAFWINPVAWLMRRELIHVHEYQVDQIMYNKYKAEYMEFLLSYSLGTSSNKYLL
ncbi:MAG: hypothetical protein JNJ99_15320, partial [Crocinitomicaceae bacterium]|nr:hypothetical protein [Crocinitomicaceae bacterium]